jgi:two-component system, NarL family, response regulator LiaR
VPGDHADREGEELGGGHLGSAPARAIVADNDPLASRTIKDALQMGGIVVIAEARNGREAVELTLHYRPDIVVMDVVMPELDGISAMRRILEVLPDQIVVVLTSGEEDEFGMLALRAGAAGFLNKSVDLDVLPRALDGIRDGEAVVSRRLTRRLVEELRQRQAGHSGLRPVKSPLSTREWEVVDLLAGGMTTDEMAESLVLSTETIRSHVKNILRKLAVNTRGEAVEKAGRMRGGGG